MTSLGLQGAGLSRDTANLVNAGIGIAGSVGAGDHQGVAEGR
jgi:hypothetical protein